MKMNQSSQPITTWINERTANSTNVLSEILIKSTVDYQSQGQGKLTTRIKNVLSFFPLSIDTAIQCSMVVDVSP